ncbi:hypothetical protein ACWELO_28570 [Streptomyces sp. NPDC004596]|uniref:hypothetical protein n=1 Tax=Streptomyces sp. DSM 118148 TaxID=3448667 RepID=UPI00403FFF6C
MASSVKLDATCVSEVVQVGNIASRPYTETSGTWPKPYASRILTLDVLAAQRYAQAVFEEVTLTLEIVATNGADRPQFVGYSQGPSYIWGVPSATIPGGWDESKYGVATTKLRIRRQDAVLLSNRPNDGLSYLIGVTGWTGNTALSFTAQASASRVLARAASCAIEVKDLGPNDHLGPYLG